MREKEREEESESWVCACMRVSGKEMEKNNVVVRRGWWYEIEKKVSGCACA